MKTISERILNHSLEGVPFEIIVRAGDEIQKSLAEGNPIDKAIFVSTAKVIKELAGEPPAADGKDQWYRTCIGIGEEIYAMCTKRFPTEPVDMLMKQAMSAAYRGVIDILIQKQASFKAKCYAVDV